MSRSKHHRLLVLKLMAIFCLILFHSALPLLFSFLRFHFMAHALMSESKEFMSGKVIRIVVMNVSTFLNMESKKKLIVAFLKIRAHLH
jgi:hypothetical protein